MKFPEKCLYFWKNYDMSENNFVFWEKFWYVQKNFCMSGKFSDMFQKLFLCPEKIMRPPPPPPPPLATPLPRENIY